MTAGTLQQSDDSPEAIIPANFRDLGGWVIDSRARVRHEQLYRSGKLATLKAASRVTEMSVRTVYDLRTEPERVKAPDCVPIGCRYVLIDVLSAIPDTVSAALRTILGNPDAITSVLQDGDADVIIAELYSGFVSFPSARAAYGRLFKDFLMHEHRPALLHCNAGKDRTGWAAAALLTLLGVSREDVFRDYLLSNGLNSVGNDCTDTPKGDVLRTMDEGGGSALLPKLIVGVDESYLAAAFDELRVRYGTIERYFTEGLGIDAREQQALRDILIENV